MKNLIRTQILRIASGLIFTCLSWSVAMAQATFDLATVEPDGVLPGGTTLEWHTAIPVSAGNLVSNKNAVVAGLYYAVYNYGSDCYSKPSPYKIIQASCAGTADITASVETTDIPAGSEVTYHSASPATDGNKLVAGNMTTAAVGSYYVAYYNTTGMCYSNASPVKVIAAVCNSVTIAINDINETPVGVPAHGNVLTNDSDPDGDIQVVNTTPIVGPTHGSVVLNADGTYTYTPTGTYTGTDSFTYEVCDDGTPQACATATVTIQIVPVATNDNNPPVANDDTGKTPNNVPLTGTLVNNDSDPDGDPLTVNETPVSGPSHGTIDINPDGTFTYTPNSGYVGTDVIVYEVCDNGSPTPLCDQATLVITVTAPNAANETYANDDAKTGKKGVVLTGNLESNDSDPENDVQTITTVKSGTTTLNVNGITENSLPSGGNIVIASNGTYTYTPDPDFVGTEILTYTTCDAGTPQACATATLYLTTLDEVCVLEIGGTVYSDSNSDNEVKGTAVNGVTFGLYVSLVSEGTVLTTVGVGTDGKYIFTNQSKGYYELVLSGNAAGSNTSTLPSGIHAVEEGGDVNGTSGYNEGDGSPNGATFVYVDCNEIIYSPARISAEVSYLHIDFGIAGSALPVTLIDFKAKRSTEGALVEWRTVAEKDFEHFELEASANAAKGFSLISTLKGGKSSYTYTDKTLTADTRYYRLKMIDMDGTFAYSRTISVSSDASATTASLYPNPVMSRTFYVKSSGPIESHQVYNAAGKQVAARITQQGNIYQITLANGTQPGIYILTYKVQGQILKRKFVIAE